MNELSKVAPFLWVHQIVDTVSQGCQIKASVKVNAPPTPFPLLSPTRPWCLHALSARVPRVAGGPEQTCGRDGGTQDTGGERGGHLLIAKCLCVNRP